MGDRVQKWPPSIELAGQDVKVSEPACVHAAVFLARPNAPVRLLPKIKRLDRILPLGF
jgi:hypothetical protein